MPARKVLVLAPLLVLAALLAVSFGALLWLSPGRLEPLPGRRPIAEKLRVAIGGVEQGMFLEGTDATRPVLLFVHGGPGYPEHAVARRYPRVLEDEFVVAWWEQRGSGMSFHPGLTVTSEQLVQDTIEVSRFLRERFGRDRIYLLAHSGGTFLGLQAAARAPELYEAYVGVAQITHQMESEKLAWRTMLDAYRAAGDEATVKRLEAIPLPQLDTMPDAYRAMRDDLMHRLGIGTTREMRSVFSGVFLPVWTAPEYTLREKVDLWRGKWSENTVRMWNHVLATDLRREVPRLEVPAYFLHGAHDHTVSYELARAWVQRELGAPRKGFYTFPESAHSPIFEEPERLRRVIEEDLLPGRTSLADAR